MASFPRPIRQAENIDCHLAFGVNFCVVHVHAQDEIATPKRKQKSAKMKRKKKMEKYAAVVHGDTFSVAIARASLREKDRGKITTTQLVIPGGKWQFIASESTKFQCCYLWTLWPQRDPD